MTATVHCLYEQICALCGQRICKTHALRFHHEGKVQDKHTHNTKGATVDQMNAIFMSCTIYVRQSVHKVTSNTVVSDIYTLNLVGFYSCYSVILMYIKIYGQRHLFSLRNAQATQWKPNFPEVLI